MTRNGWKRRLPGRRLAPVLVLAVSGWLLLGGHAPRHAEADSCGGTDGELCYVKYDCKRILIFWKRCTTEYGYYPAYL